MKIVILDSVIINEGQEARLKHLGTLAQYTDTPRDDQEIIGRCQGADIIITGWTTFNRQVLEALQEVKLIALWSTGYEQIDLEGARTYGISVCNVRGYARNAVAELAVGLMLDVLRKISLANQVVKETSHYDWQPFPGRELTGKTIGIIGFGAIGQKLSKIAHGFDMDILVHSPQVDKSLAEALDVEVVSLESLLERSHVVSLHLPLLKETEGLINRQALSLMKAESILINTSRGGLIDQEALVSALEEGAIRGAGLDDILLGLESTDALKSLDNVVLTPHIGFNTAEATVVKTDACIDNVENFLRKQATNLII
jgi:lactate dehydrogenase-like 2-hydroxyacid dehydrogenase